MSRIFTLLILLSIFFTSCVSTKKYNEDMAKLKMVDNTIALNKILVLEKEIVDLKIKMERRDNTINKLQNQVLALEKKINDLQKIPQRTNTKEQIQKNQKSSY